MKISQVLPESMMSTSSVLHASIDVLGTRRRRQNGADVTALFGRDVLVDPTCVSEYCFKNLDPRVDDLLHIAAAIGFVDRAVRRASSRTWRRELNVRIAVYDPDFWGQSTISRALIDCLDLVTGDIWAISFVGGRILTQLRPQAPLELKQGRPVVMPFSDGLDSLAAARLTSLREPDSTLVLVTTGRKHDVDRVLRRRHLNGRRHRVSLPFTYSRSGQIRLPETSYRSRGFLFSIAAASAAYLLEADRVVLGESGQGALGPWLVPVGNESPDVRMHPLFTIRMARLLRLALGRPIVFEHPHLWMTKSETLGQLRDADLASEWWETRSCARDQRHMSLGGQRAQCGICAACLLRRQSLGAAGLRDPRDIYLWHNLSAPDLDAAAVGSARQSRPNDERQGLCGVLALEDLAHAADGDFGAARVAQAAEVMAPLVGLQVDAALDRLLRLTAAHRAEWSDFVTGWGTSSLIARWAEAVRC